jgi:O-antigen chain-terminating methyltransferase
MNSDPASSLPSLSELVTALPEIYQPIYGHDEFDALSKRNVKDRLSSILAIHDALARHLERPLRVLDLGCAQGWFSFNLAKAGAQVVGIDIIAANINVCNMLALENRGLNARFKLFEAEQVPATIPEDAFDLVLGLSVVHHLCFHNGKEATRAFMEALFAKIPNGIFEFALASEPTELAPAQPNDPEFLIDYLPFYKILSKHPSHLSSSLRPLYFCSNKFSYEEGVVSEITAAQTRTPHR